jgi:cytochrome b561
MITKVTMSEDIHIQNVPLSQAKPVQYDRMMVVLHWLLAMGLLYQLGLGLWMDDLPKEPVGERAQWFNLHKSIGICLGLFILWRLGWRITHSVPAPVNPAPSWQHKTSTLTHWSMYACMLLLPITGFAGSNFSAYPVKFFGIELPKLFEPDPALKSLMSESHEWLASIFMTLVLLHFLAALWHGWVKRDGLLRRMAWGRADSN